VIQIPVRSIGRRTISLPATDWKGVPRPTSIVKSKQEYEIIARAGRVPEGGGRVEAVWLALTSTRLGAPILS